MSTNEKNRFSTLLEELISISGVKNSGLAKALQYDASYISKWVSGRLLPTEKTKKKILSGLSHEIVNQSTSEGLENLYANYQVSFPEELENTVGIGIMLTLTVKTVNHARIFFIFLIVPPSHELMC